MTITTLGSHITAAVNVILQREFLEVAKFNLPYFVGSMPGQVMHHGNTTTAKWRRIEKRTPTTTALSELTGNLSLPTRQGTVSTITDITATVAKYGDREYITEEVSLTNPSNLEMRLVQIHGMQAGESLNRLQRNELEDNSTLIYAGGVSADGNVTTIISRDDIRNAVNTLRRNGAMMFTPQTNGSTNVGTSPIRPAYWGICHVDVEEDIRDLSSFIAVERYSGQTATATGEFGTVDGVRFISTAEASIDTDSGGTAGNTLRSDSGTNADLYSTVIFGQEYHGSLGFGMEHLKEQYQTGDELPAVMLGSMSPGTRSIADPHGEMGFFAWDTWHVAKILNANWGRAIRTGASKLAN